MVYEGYVSLYGLRIYGDESGRLWRWIDFCACTEASRYPLWTVVYACFT